MMIFSNDKLETCGNYVLSIIHNFFINLVEGTNAKYYTMSKLA